MLIEVKEDYSVDILEDAGQIVEGIFGIHNHEIVSNKPGILIEWGSTIFLIIILLMLIICWFVQYPDIVSANAKLTSINAPKEVIAKTDGKLEKLFIKEAQRVEKGQIIGYIESTGDYRQTLKLQTLLDTLSSLVQQGKMADITRISIERFDKLGELQLPYQSFVQSFLLFRTYISDGFYLHKRKVLQEDMNNLLRLHATLLEQKELEEQDLSLAQETFDAQGMLHSEKVISPLEYRNEKSKLIGKKLTLPQINASIINNENEQNGKQKEIMELDNTIAQQRSIFLQTLNTLMSQILEWERKYLLVAPVSGEVSYATFLQENLQLRSNQVICYINSENSQYYVEMYIPQTNFGKVKVGQTVLLKFPSYPFEEYGSVIGKIEFISHIPTDSGYLSKVVLPSGLLTIYKKRIVYREGLISHAEIITQNRRLLERFYRNTIKMVKT